MLQPLVLLLHPMDWHCMALQKNSCIDKAVDNTSACTAALLITHYTAIRIGLHKSACTSGVAMQHISCCTCCS
jgi:hypothetical protein